MTAPSILALFLFCAICTGANNMELNDSDAEANGIASIGDGRRLWGSWGSWKKTAQSWVSAGKEKVQKGQTAASAAMGKASAAKAEAEKMAADTRKAAHQAGDMVESAKKALEEAAKDPTTALLKAALKVAGTCPAIVAASNTFIKSSMPDLVDQVATELAGDCKELKSTGCGRLLSKLSSDYLVESTEQSMGVPQAKKIIKDIDQLTAKIGTYTNQAQCSIDSFKDGIGTCSDIKKEVPGGTMDKIDDISDALNVMDDTIENVKKLLDPAKAVVTLWNSGKIVIKHVLGSIGEKAIAEVQPLIPDSVQETVDEKSKFISEMGTYLQSHLGDIINNQIDKYCPGASSSSRDEDSAAELSISLKSMLASMMDPVSSIDKLLADAEEKAKNQMKQELVDLVDKLQAKFSGPDRQLQEVDKTCTQNMQKIASDIQACTQKEDFTKLYLEGSEAHASRQKLRGGNEPLAKVLVAKPSSALAAWPTAFGTIAASVVAAAALLAVVAAIRQRQQNHVYSAVDDMQLA